MNEIDVTDSQQQNATNSVISFKNWNDQLHILETWQIIVQSRAQATVGNEGDIFCFTWRLG